ncbi:uncharacterized protein LOC144746362 [Ciona intestinalis]
MPYDYKKSPRTYYKTYDELCRTQQWRRRKLEQSTTALNDMENKQKIQTSTKQNLRNIIVDPSKNDSVPSNKSCVKSEYTPNEATTSESQTELLPGLGREDSVHLLSPEPDIRIRSVESQNELVVPLDIPSKRKKIRNILSTPGESSYTTDDASRRNEKLSKNIAVIKRKVARNTDDVAHLRANVGKLLAGQTKHTHDLANIKSLLGQLIQETRAAMNAKVPTQFVPVETDTELNNMIKNFKSFEQVAGQVNRNSLRGTIRAFIRLFMKKTLAQQYSWSGLGSGRKAIKKSFKDHRLCAILLGVLPFTDYKGTDVSIVGQEITRVLQGVVDWEGGRDARRSIKENTRPMLTCNMHSDKSVNTEPMFTYLSSDSTGSSSESTGSDSE